MSQNRRKKEKSEEQISVKTKNLWRKKNIKSLKWLRVDGLHVIRLLTQLQAACFFSNLWLETGQKIYETEDTYVMSMDWFSRSVREKITQGS